MHVKGKYEAYNQWNKKKKVTITRTIQKKHIRLEWLDLDQILSCQSTKASPETFVLYLKLS